MKPVHIREALFLLERVHLFAIQNEGDGRFQHLIEGNINMTEGITSRSKKQKSILFIYLFI